MQGSGGNMIGAIGQSMCFSRFVRISYLALAAVTAVAAPALYARDGPGHGRTAGVGPGGPGNEAGAQGRFRRGRASGAALRATRRRSSWSNCIYLRDHPNDAGYQRIMDFLDAAPKWPLTESLLKRAERSLYVNAEPPQLILDHFAKRQPVTPEGSLALARALIANGDRDTRAASMCRRSGTIPGSMPRWKSPCPENSASC